MGRREQAAWRRERLLDAALEVFVEKGVDGAGVKEIAEAAGVTQGLLYHYFEGKQAMLTTLLEERSFLSSMRRQLAAASDRPAAEVLPEMMRDYHRVLSENTRLVFLFFGAGRTNPHVGEAMREVMAEGQRLLTEYLDARAAVGEIRPQDTGLLARTLLTSMAVARYLGSDTDPDRLVDLLLNGAVAPQRQEAGR